ncbi:ABC transporter ATP-binding protein [Hyphomicrobium sp.]|uniref:ABC transporter ATP-binding protein n=1 Tax=Hyphomicrobium sp. TaxID=82 RepID=UPI003FA532C8
MRDVSFTLAGPETVALVGHNGAGKTTLMKLMLGLAHPTAGTIHVLGADPAARASAARRRIGYLPESVSFNPALTGREILAFYARLKDVTPAAAFGLLDRVGLKDAASRAVGTYSKGMRQRLGLAQALIGSPQLLLLDEPTSGLDPALRQEFYGIVGELRDGGATVVLSSHALTEIEDRAERVIIMSRGRVVADGTMEELRRIAKLPARIRLTIAPDKAEALMGALGPVAGLRKVNGRMVEFEAGPGEKIALVRRATEPGAAAEDVAVIPPTLDELYAFFLKQGAPTT